MRHKTLRLAAESYAEMPYTAAGRTYRLIVLRKNISVLRGEDKMGDEIRYHFYVTNVPAAEMSAPDVIFQSNARCNQENVIKQLKNGVQAMRMPAGDLVANWAYMAIATLAFNIKAWLGLLLPRRAGGAQLLTMDFRHNGSIRGRQNAIPGWRSTSDTSPSAAPIPTRREPCCANTGSVTRNAKRPSRATEVKRVTLYYYPSRRRPNLSAWAQSRPQADACSHARSQWGHPS